MGGSGVTLQVHPAGQGITGHCHQKPAAVRTEASDEFISYRRDNAGVDRRKRKSGCPTGITDRDPALNDFLPQPGTHLRRIEALAQHRNSTLVHTGSLADAYDEAWRTIRICMTDRAMSRLLEQVRWYTLTARTRRSWSVCLSRNAPRRSDSWRHETTPHSAR